MQPNDKSSRPDAERSSESTTAEDAMVAESDGADDELLNESAYSKDEE